MTNSLEMGFDPAKNKEEAAFNGPDKGENNVENIKFKEVYFSGDEDFKKKIVNIIDNTTDTTFKPSTAVNPTWDGAATFKGEKVNVHDTDKEKFLEKLNKDFGDNTMSLEQTIKFVETNVEELNNYVKAKKVVVFGNLDRALLAYTKAWGKQGLQYIDKGDLNDENYVFIKKADYQNVEKPNQAA